MQTYHIMTLSCANFILLKKKNHIICGLKKNSWKKKFYTFSYLKQLELQMKRVSLPMYVSLK